MFKNIKTKYQERYLIRINEISEYEKNLEKCIGVKFCKNSLDQLTIPSFLSFELSHCF